MITGVLILVLQFPLLIVYTSNLKYCNDNIKKCTPSTPFGSDVMGIFILIQLPFTLVQISVFVAMWASVRKVLESMLLWHDYLVSYKQTPSSRRKRKPYGEMPLEAIEEVESQYERSEVMSKVSAGTTKTAKKFKYREQFNMLNPRRVSTFGAKVPQEEEESSDSASSEDSAEAIADHSMTMSISKDPGLSI